MLLLHFGQSKIIITLFNTSCFHFSSPLCDLHASVTEMVLLEDSYSNSTPSFPSASTHRFFYAPPSSSSKVRRFPLDHVLSHSSPSFSFNLSDSAVIDLRLAELASKPLSYTSSRSNIFSSQSHDLYHSLDLSQSFASDFSNISGELRRLSIIPDLRPNPSSNPEHEPEPWPGFLLRDSFSTGIINSISPEDLLPTVKLCIDGLNSKSIAIRRSAAAKLRLLAKNRPDNRALIGDAGAIPALIRLLRYSDPFTQEHAVTALFNLSLYETNTILLSNAGAVKPLIYVLKTGTEISKQNAACVLLNLALVDDKNKLSIGACGAIPPLVALLESCSERGKKDALTTLYKLCSVKSNKERAVNAGAVRPLVGLVVDQGTGLAEKAMVVLNSLAVIESGSEAIVEEGGIAALVEAIEDGSSDKGKEFAVLTLLQLCGDNFRNRDLLVREGGIPPLVALSQTGTAKAKHKAKRLLEYLREPREEASTSTTH